VGVSKVGGKSGLMEVVSQKGGVPEGYGEVCDA
jgi:hypothetical protein